jgi:hypothetical protein
LESELIKAIPNGGQLVVFVIVVVVFLRQMQAVTTSFQAQIQASTSAFQTQIQALTDNVVSIAKDTSRAIGELTTAVRALEVTVEQH